MYNKSIDDVLKEFSTDKNKGLSEAEAKARLEKNGLNKLSSKKPKTLLSIFLAQINDAMIYILIGAAIISAIMGEYSDSIVILIVILINAIIGVVQESKAEKALSALKELSTPKALVKRNGEVIEIPSEEVVLGDIVVIDAGRYIPCDLRLIQTANLKIEESAFTGESVPADKDATKVFDSKDIPVGDRENMAYMSTLATYGRGIGVCVATAMDTEIGKIAKMIENEEEDMTPLQKKLSSLGKILGIAAIIICVLIFVIGLFQGRDTFEMALTAISLAVAAIPEGLPAIVAIVLALGVQRMIKQNAIVKKLPAVETLGSVNIICSDKTGTLTLNKMTVRKVYDTNSILSVDDINDLNDNSKILFETMILCNDATLSDKGDTGDPTEIALLDIGVRFNYYKDELNNKYNRIDEIPFDSDRKLMSTVNKYDNHYRVHTKGAIDSLFKVCTKILINGEIKDLTDPIKKDLLSKSNEMSNEALRVLGGAYKDLESENTSIPDIEKDLIFVGLMGMIDPPREEVKGSIDLCDKAGITTIMITGDHKNTAYAIGHELGISSDFNECIEGNELDTLSDDEIKNNINKYRIFARVSPEHKVKIVKAFKSHGNIVSMTGDGVNDAPSLKAADIGVAMGITGTDVAKGAADMILTDDNFTTIVGAVEEGRNIYSNIKKSITFLLSGNFGEVIALFVAIVLNWAAPLQPIHILWVNLITDSFPALALGVDPGDEGVMEYPPRNPKESIFTKDTIFTLIINGLTVGITTLIAFKTGLKYYSDSIVHAQTMAFVVLSISQLFLSFSLRDSKKSIFKVGILKNKALLFSLILGVVLQILIISVPFLSSVFKTYPLSFGDFEFVFLISLVPLVINEISKLILGIFRK
ncbi:calcium-translocating P-type ATPase, PMCA-type [Clostridium sardiniense]|uniref:P-type Ca(2+) transporter n=1 Tax=Clostridium sardiniense TaxID=29369 RepID=A0ABS7L0A1_CLOSR|nr:calcium-translocating P-type ATPase, PMCA-type [Clostridium sardiniense]MBY0756454.1 calcium-translocating P-type ATPase, PMCA-type [Clostridium sardiniense]MDQ0460195.1 Ca2+-transporting ATPase [Clostridium sardiniense]